VATRSEDDEKDVHIDFQGQPMAGSMDLTGLTATGGISALSLVGAGANWTVTFDTSIEPGTMLIFDGSVNSFITDPGGLPVCAGEYPIVIP